MYLTVGIYGMIDGTCGEILDSPGCQRETQRN